ncbi:MAG: exo-alpha-sialidase, partial [Planctomycetota bacterium]|nr:exo-alpha-sialidase [Planctomycetota bacterium]
MSRHFKLTLILTLALCMLSAAAFAGPIEMHPKGEKLPTTHQGPFVTTGDGSILAVGASNSFISEDNGKTWKAYPLFKDNKKHTARPERALLRTRDGVVVFGWMNDRGRQRGKWGTGGEAEVSKWIIPTCISRSLDDGKTWEEPIKIQDRWCGAIRCLIELKSGRLVLVGQKLIPWQHITLTYISDDKGKTWKASNDIVLGGHHDHDGAMEATIVERKDGSIHMLIRTTKGWQYEAVSTDEGLTWKNVRNSGVQSSTCCATYARLADGSIALLWNRMPKHNPTSMASREEMSIAFSKDDGKTWSKPQVVAARYAKPGDSWANRILGYPYLYEAKPGELWITTMQGGLRMKINQADLESMPDPADSIRPKSIVMLGDSTTERRKGIKKVYAKRVAEALCGEGIDVWVTNSGVPGDTTEGARKRFKKDVLDHNPHLVVIQLGANDSAIDVWKDPPAKSPRVSLEQY